MTSGVRLSACGSGDATPAPVPRTGSSGVAWIDEKVAALRGAREHLTGLGMAPQPIGGEGRYSLTSGWRIPHWVGVFSDAQLLEMARERGFSG